MTPGPSNSALSCTWSRNHSSRSSGNCDVGGVRRKTWTTRAGRIRQGGEWSVAREAWGAAALERGIKERPSFFGTLGGWTCRVSREATVHEADLVLESRRRSRAAVIPNPIDSRRVERVRGWRGVGIVWMYRELL